MPGAGLRLYETLAASAFVRTGFVKTVRVGCRTTVTAGRTLINVRALETVTGKPRLAATFVASISVAAVGILMTVAAVMGTLVDISFTLFAFISRQTATAV